MCPQVSDQLGLASQSLAESLCSLVAECPADSGERLDYMFPKSVEGNLKAVTSESSFVSTV